VPLSADAEIESIGADLAAGIGSFVGEQPMRVVLMIAGAFAMLVAVRVARLAVERRRRGRWGILQDRFATLASRRGAAAAGTNPTLATAWTSDDDAEVARLVAERLDRVAFDPTFADADDVFRDTRKLVSTLRGPDR